MSEAIKIHLETARQLSPPQELKILRAAYARRPSLAVRTGLATLLLQCDAFGEAIALLSGAADLNFREEILLAQALLALKTPPDARRAGEAADRGLGLANGAAKRAMALAIRGKVEIRLGNRAAARATLEHALAEDPLNKDAFKRLVALDLAEDPAAVLATANSLGARGAAHARLFAARAVAQARHGEMDAARATLAFDDLHYAGQLAVPPGWASIGAFNAALAEELLSHPGLRYERYGTASELSWRIDAPATRDAPLVRLLLDRIAEAIAEHIGGLEIDHPWVDSRPAEAILHSWCVITESEGFESWHVHPFGWLSGVYYVQVPDSIANGENRDGCLAFGLPEDEAGSEAAAAYGVEVVRPQEGLMLAFPSHTFHRTFPHGSREKRICLAFDLKPA